MSHIAILGAGLVGRLLALLLAKTNAPNTANTAVQISLFEQHGINAANTTGRVAAAMIAPMAESVSASANIVAMGQQSLKLWPSLLQHLQLKTVLQQSGTLVLAHRQDHNEIQHFQQRLKAANTATCHTLSQAQLQTLEPELAGHFSHALWLSDEAHIDNHQLYDETSTALRAANINLFEQCKTELIGDSLMADQQIVDCDWIIDCRGMGAKVNMLNSANPLRGVRGEIVRVYAPEVNLQRPIRLMHPRYAIYIVPKANQQFVIGATEIESADDKAPSVRSTLELLSAAYSIHRGFAEAEIVSIQAALRPTLMDNEPRIISHGKLIQINGLYRHGYLLAPYIVQQSLILLSQLGVPVSLVDPPVYSTVSAPLFASTTTLNSTLVTQL